MATDIETVADIIAEKRRRADEIERDCAEKMRRGEMVSDCYARELVADIRREADRLEAALKREIDELKKQVGNAAKLREALKLYDRIFQDRTLVCDCDVVCGARALARAALAAPPRNCDVGTAEEQDERFHRFCVMQRKGSCAGCPDPVGGRTVANGIRECALIWAQMPYESGAAK